MEINIGKSTFYMDGKTLQSADSTIKVESGKESSNGDLFHNANGELFSETRKIFTIGRVGLVSRIKNKLKKRRL